VIRDNITRLVFVTRRTARSGRAADQSQALLDVTIPAVSRIDLIGAQFDWVGTGWLVAGIIVTNRHVAKSSRSRRRLFV
jgi:hypothetical protein